METRVIKAIKHIRSRSKNRTTRQRKLRFVNEGVSVGSLLQAGMHKLETDDCIFQKGDNNNTSLFVTRDFSGICIKSRNTDNSDRNCPKKNKVMHNESHQTTVKKEAFSDYITIVHITILKKQTNFVNKEFVIDINIRNL